MIKKICAVAALTVMIMISLCACGNKDMWDTNYTFNVAMCYGDFDEDGIGEWKIFEVEQWIDYEGDSVQIETKEGEIYLFHASNCTLINRTIAL